MRSNRSYCGKTVIPIPSPCSSLVQGGPKKLYIFSTFYFVWFILTVCLPVYRILMNKDWIKTPNCCHEIADTLSNCEASKRQLCGQADWLTAKDLTNALRTAVSLTNGNCFSSETQMAPLPHPISINRLLLQIDWSLSIITTNSCIHQNVFYRTNVEIMTGNTRNCLYTISAIWRC